VYSIFQITCGIDNVSAHKNLGSRISHSLSVPPRYFLALGAVRVVPARNRLRSDILVLLLPISFNITSLKAWGIVAKEESFSDIDSQYRLQCLERVLHKKIESIETREVHMELMDIIKQISVHFSNITETFNGTCGQRKARWEE